MKMLPALATGILVLSPAAMAGPPVITAISAVTTEQTQTITVSGKNFGTMDPYTGDSPYIYFVDCLHSKSRCSIPGSWGAGETGDAVTLSVSSWTPTSVVITGFAGEYGTGSYFLHDGDYFHLGVTNPQTDVHSKKSRCLGIVGAGATTCHKAK